MSENGEQLGVDVGVAESIGEALDEKASRCYIQEVRIGLVYTAVLIGEKDVGLAYTFREGNPQCCPSLLGDFPLAGRKAADLLAYLGSSDRVESSLGLATANALADYRESEFLPGDILEVLALQPGDRVGMIGHFEPLVESVKRRVSSLSIFEQEAGRAPGLLPEEKAFEFLPACDVALITSTAIINNTIDRLLAAAQNCREVILLGASTPLIPEVFQNTPVTFLSGVVVTDPGGILRVVSEGGGMRRFKGFIQKVNLRVARR